MELTNRSSLYIRGVIPRCFRRVFIVEAPARSAPLATLPEVSFPDPKVAPHTLYKVPSCLLLAPLTPQFLGFPPLFQEFLKIFSPRVLASVRRALNRPTALSRHPKTPEFRGRTAHARLAVAPKIPAKHPSRALKNPPLTHPNEKKLSLFHSTLLTVPPRECILEYMRLKGAAQTTPHGAASAAPTASENFKLTRLALEEAGH